ncbi:MAG: mandelate racemase/muconate lactonizing enzyme family protein [Chloroflexi bacterium]|nr:mandelate racemase/muconate lactonizing enzyme family protein [Chloroflexota bacterium]
MKIIRIEATTHRIPATVPLLREPIMREIVFVRLETDTGVAGYGLTGPIQRFAVKELINKEIAPLLVGKEPLATERHWYDLFYRLNPRAQTGTWSSAVSAVDIALWDVKGKHLGQPIWRLLGGYSATVPAYVTFGLLEYNREQLVETAKHFTAQGHDKLKMVVAISGGQDPAEDAARVRLVREAVGERVELMVDANYLFSFPHALELAKRIEPYGIKWFEEPVYGNDVRLLTNLRRLTRIPISAGQNEGHKWRHRELLVHEAVDILQPNVVYVGGYTEGVKVAAMAQAYNLPIANGGGWPHHNMHLIAGVANGWRVEFHVPMWVTGEMIFRDPPKPSRGTVTLTERPGLGLEPDEEALKDTKEP